MSEGGRAGGPGEVWQLEDLIRSRFSPDEIEQIRSDSADLEAECSAYALANPDYAREHQVWQERYEAECAAYEQAIAAGRTPREAYGAALAVRAATTSAVYEEAIAAGRTIRQAIDAAMGAGAAERSGRSA